MINYLHTLNKKFCPVCQNGNNTIFSSKYSLNHDKFAQGNKDLEKKNVLAFDKEMDCADPRHKPNIKKV